MRSSRIAVGVEVDEETRPARVAVVEEEPFRIAILGDFSGCGRGSRRDLDEIHGQDVDRDNFDEVMARIAPRLRSSDGSEISFSSLDDFHPDRLFERLPAFQIRDRQSESAAGAASGRRSLLERMIEESGRPHPEPPRADPGELMRALLHSAEFQALEAAWRGVFFLIRRLETGAALKLYLFDVTRQELAADLERATDLHDTFLYRKFARRIEGAPEWSLLAGNYTFGASPEDVELLARVALISSQVGAPFLAAASPAAAGCRSVSDLSELRTQRVPDHSDAEFWRTLRQMPEASWLGLALPRLLLRLPYGKETNSTESLAFEEMAGSRPHEEYLWGNPAFACACLIGLAFQQFGWEMRPGFVRELTGLPLHLYKEDEEWHAKPCAEVQFSDDAAEGILDQGLILLISAKDGDRILTPAFRSLADPWRALAGPWDRH